MAWVAPSKEVVLVEAGEGWKLFCLTLRHLTFPLSLPREKAPKEKPNQPPLRQPRQGPTDEAQMAAAAALARLEQKQPRARGPASQDAIRNQGGPCAASGCGGAGPWVLMGPMTCLALGANNYITNDFGTL